MASLDVNSLFTSITQDETIDLYIDNLYNDNQNFPNIPKHDFCNFLNVATRESFFTFNRKYYKQVDGVNNFGIVIMISNLCSLDLVLMMYLHCFLLLIMQAHFKEYLSSKHPNINFSVEKEKDGCLPFLNANIFLWKREVCN